MSQLTTHILDTSLGKPAKGIRIHLEQNLSGKWSLISSGVTNEDGRISDLLAKEIKLAFGIYRMIFDVKPYFEKQNIKSFYPSVTVEFEISEDSHYHIPLLLNPFGYSTYRGS
ncbi:MAG: hydroxyisourate hydrolase [Bacteroidota bacterium]